MSEDVIKQRTVVTQVMEEMRNRISSGEYKPGEKIPTEAELSAMFGVGRSSIRESIKIFNYLGVLKSETGTGTRVCESANITTKALSWALVTGTYPSGYLLELRGVIETQCIRLLTRRFRNAAEDLEELKNGLEACIDDFHSAQASENPLGVVEIDFRFHRTIIQGSENDVYIKIWDTLKFFLLDEIKQVEELSIDSDTVAEHENILRAIISGKEEEAVVLLQLHMNDIKEKLLSLRK